MSEKNIVLLKEITAAVQGYSAEQLLGHILSEFGDRVAFASSFGAEDQVITDMLCKLSDSPKIFTLDTGRLPQETYDIIDATSKKYGIEIKVLFPESQQVEEMVNKLGTNLFYDSIENRKLCCKVRKIEPLKRQLAKLDAWICGLRSEQSVTRQELMAVEWDNAFDLIKICPLADWTTEQVWDYIKKNDVPYNKLHDEGYPSIGCEPCTRAVAGGADIRSGRWWWENPEHKECGLHPQSKDNKQNTGEQK